MSGLSRRHQEHLTFEKLPVKPIIYYQKPVIGDGNPAETLPPIQIIFPNGNFGLGIPVKDQGDNTNLSEGNHPVVSSGPEEGEHDIMEKDALRCAFLVLFAFNLTVTCLMYANADTVDTSKVEDPVQSFPTVFEKVSGHRSYTENVNFAFFLITIFIGALSAIFEFPLGLSAYALSVVVNFLLGTSALPYFVYSLRYIFDVFMLYIALVLRTRLMYTFLPAHIHRNT